MASLILPAVGLYEVAKGIHCEVWVSMAKDDILGELDFILSQENCESKDEINTFVIEREEPREASVSSTVP
jgi:hypothetical protein